jgi:hypothetical protein
MLMSAVEEMQGHEKVILLEDVISPEAIILLDHKQGVLSTSSFQVEIWRLNYSKEDISKIVNTK